MWKENRKIISFWVKQEKNAYERNDGEICFFCLITFTTLLYWYEIVYILFILNFLLGFLRFYESTSNKYLNFVFFYYYYNIFSCFAIFTWKFIALGCLIVFYMTVSLIKLNFLKIFCLFGCFYGRNDSLSPIWLKKMMKNKFFSAWSLLLLCNISS